MKECSYFFFLSANQFFTNTKTGGISEIAIIAITTIVKLFFTNGMFPNRKPAKQNEFTQSIFPIILNEKNFLYFMVPTPATKGANVLIIGINLAIITVLPPCFS